MLECFSGGDFKHPVRSRRFPIFALHVGSPNLCFNFSLCVHFFLHLQAWGLPVSGSLHRSARSRHVATPTAPPRGLQANQRPHAGAVIIGTTTKRQAGGGSGRPWGQDLRSSMATKEGSDGRTGRTSAPLGQEGLLPGCWTVGAVLQNLRMPHAFR